MSIFQILEPTVLKKNESVTAQIEKLKGILPKASEPVQEVIEQDIKLLETGLYGEGRIMYELQNSHIPMYILQDVFLCHKDLTAQIDFMVICQKCMYVIECKNLFGNIEINNKGDFIRTLQFGKQYRKEGIYSPITQNQRHLEMIKDIVIDNKGLGIANRLLGEVFAATHIPIVVLANDKTVVNDRFARKEVKDKVIRADQLVSFIKSSENSCKQIKKSYSEMKSSAVFWLSKCTDNPVDYIEKYRELEREYRRKHSAKETTVPKCPVCGATMVKREAKTGANRGRQFWGCPNYPKCKGIVNINE